MESEYIDIIGARVNNLKNVNVRIPRGKLTVITGLSGSGKSSLAFDTIFAEGQRRYIDTFSAYARGFIGQVERPDVDKITGLSPVIAIDQKTTNRNPRSTVGTQTEVYDYLRLLYARAGQAYSYLTGEKMVHYTDEQIADIIEKTYAEQKIILLAPLVKNRKGHYKELFDRYRKKGFLYVRVDGELLELEMGMRVDRYKQHDIELVIDRTCIGLPVAEDEHKRLLNSIRKSMEQGEGVMTILTPENQNVRYFSRRLMCPTTGLSYRDPAPHTFSFNSPHGSCERCHGLGQVLEIDIDKIIPDRRLSIRKGAIKPLALKGQTNSLMNIIDHILNKWNCSLDTPFQDIPEQCIDEIINGTNEEIHLSAEMTAANYFLRYEGLARYLEMGQEDGASETEQHWSGQFMRRQTCPCCGGARLNKEALSYRFLDKNIAELASMDIDDLLIFLTNAEQRLDEKQRSIATEILKEICTRLHFMLDVGVGYLSLNRSSDSLSGGENQRIRLATQLGSQLRNVLYILDEPSIGLHQRDNERLIQSLCQLRDRGNTVIVVEHDEEMMRRADYVIDIGPGAGRLGGHIVFAGTPKEMLQANTITADYLNGKRAKETAPKYTNPQNWLTLTGCTGNNLKHVNVSIPLGKMVCVTGVSGSGKSTLVNQTLYPILSQHLYRSLQEPLPYESVTGLEFIDKVIAVDQSPIGRTPRSNPATYTGVFTDIRQLFAQLPESQIRGWKANRFSFNTGTGRCEACAGNGYKSIEMNYLPTVYVPCELCNGQRYNRETLVARFKGKTIAEVLEMTVNQAVEFFEAQPAILAKIKTIQQVGLGYIKLGQPSNTLSGGESQRMKLAAELARKETGRTFYIFDEPTTGLHFHDIQILLNVLRQLVEKGNTVLIIEHNMDVIQASDYLIDMGIDGGKEGGEIIAYGTQKEVKQSKRSITAQYL